MKVYEVITALMDLPAGGELSVYAGGGAYEIDFVSSISCAIFCEKKGGDVEDDGDN